jgi:hypothetical protein
MRKTHSRQIKTLFLIVFISIAVVCIAITVYYSSKPKVMNSRASGGCGVCQGSKCRRCVNGQISMDECKTDTDCVIENAIKTKKGGGNYVACSGTCRPLTEPCHGIGSDVSPGTTVCELANQKCCIEGQQNLPTCEQIGGYCTGGIELCKYGEVPGPGGAYKKCKKDLANPLNERVCCKPHN